MSAALKSVADIDWKTWRAVDPATLVFVIQGERMLLIRKKRGLGAGKINAAGGRLEDGEAPHECAERELEEELLISATNLRYAGENRFQFVDGYSIHVWVYVADGFTGTPTETDEAAPLWFTKDNLPWDEMWEDDHLWVPLMLDGIPWSGRFLFDGDRMIDHEMEVLERAPAAAPVPPPLPGS